MREGKEFPMREGKECWIQLIAPDHNCCPDNGQTFCDIVRTLLDRATVRRKLIRQLAHSTLDAFRLMVIRGDEFFVRVGTLLEWVRCEGGYFICEAGLLRVGILFSLPITVRMNNVNMSID